MAQSKRDVEKFSDPRFEVDSTCHKQGLQLSVSFQDRNCLRTVNNILFAVNSHVSDEASSARKRCKQAFNDIFAGLFARFSPNSAFGHRSSTVGNIRWITFT